MKHRKAKQDKQKLYSGGVVNEWPHLNINEVVLMVEREGRRRVTRLVDRADPYDSRGR